MVEIAKKERAVDGTILVADDDMLIRRLLKRSLELFGFTVRTVTDGEVAVNVSKDPKIKLIIMDGNMPKMSGFEASRIIKTKVNPQIKIILLTAVYAKPPIHYREGAFPIIDSFMRKPFDIKKLTAEINKLLGEISQ